MQRILAVYLELANYTLPKCELAWSNRDICIRQLFQLLRIHTRYPRLKATRERQRIPGNQHRFQSPTTKSQQHVRRNSRRPPGLAWYLVSVLVFRQRHFPQREHRCDRTPHRDLRKVSPYAASPAKPKRDVLHIVRRERAVWVQESLRDELEWLRIFRLVVRHGPGQRKTRSTSRVCEQALDRQTRDSSRPSPLYIQCQRNRGANECDVPFGM